MPIYNKVEIERAAQQHGFVRDTFEKVLRLKEILRYLNEEEYLREHLLLKGGTAINLTVFNRNFDTSAIDSLKFDKIRRDLFPVLSKKDNFKLDERKQEAKDYIAELMQLTEREQEYMDRFIAKEYVPELLFDDKEIVERIKEHPMALWKCQQ